MKVTLRHREYDRSNYTLIAPDQLQGVEVDSETYATICELVLMQDQLSDQLQEQFNKLYQEVEDAGTV